MPEWAQLCHVRNAETKHGINSTVLRQLEIEILKRNMELALKIMNKMLELISTMAAKFVVSAQKNLTWKHSDLSLC